MAQLSSPPAPKDILAPLRRHLFKLVLLSGAITVILAALTAWSSLEQAPSLLQLWLLINVIAALILILSNPVVREARHWYGSDWRLALISGLGLTLFIILAIIPNWIAPFDYNEEAGPEELPPGQQADYYILVFRTETAYTAFGDIGIDPVTQEAVPDVETPQLAVVDERAGRIAGIERQAGNGKFRLDRSPLQNQLTAQAALQLLSSANLEARSPLVALLGPEDSLKGLLDEFPNLRAGERINAWQNKTILLGTNRLGQDILSRLIYGTRTTLAVGILSALAASIIGIPIGLLSGYIGGTFDRILSPIMDSLYSFPGLILAIALAAVRGPGIDTVVASIGIIYVPVYFRVIRSHTLTVKQATYIEAARSLGASEMTIVQRYVLPNVLASVAVVFTINIADAILTGAALSFLGLGLDPSGTPEWGVDLASGFSSFPDKWWVVTLPGLAISLLTLCFSMLGESLSEILNPRINRI